MADLETTRREERDHLLSSLDDLDAEFAAGDLDEADYDALRSDYTTRAATAIRALERATPPPAGVARSWKRIALWTALIVVVAGLAGVWVAEFSGSRGVGQSGSGDIRESVRQRLFEAQGLLGSDPTAAIAIYDDVLADQPSSAEALTYRGWLTNLAGDPETAADFLERAVLSDPDYPDAQVFSAVIALRSGDAAGAADHLETLRELDPPPAIDQLVSGQGLLAGVAEALLLTGEPDAFETSGLSVDFVARAADALLDAGLPVRALQLHEVLLASAGDDVDVLTEVGWFRGRLAFSGGTELIDSMVIADELLSDALAIDSAHPPALVYRAFVRYWLSEFDPTVGHADAAAADLAAYDGLDPGRDDLDLLIESTGLRDLVRQATTS